ncbi:MAG TPA: glycogen/starch/alpha-glucan phosphorylase [bacterium]|nr:glycogen/starch/alpha-glucan phosphorylase [bacterium]
MARAKDGKNGAAGCAQSPGDVRTGTSVEAIKQSFLDNLSCGMGRIPAAATKNDLYTALAMTVRDRLLHNSVLMAEAWFAQESRIVCYLSAEYLPGPHLANNLLNLGITGAARQALSELGYDLEEIVNQEGDPGLGNGGLGRLASCYMDSLATLRVPAIGFGIRYEFGIFDQEIRDGWQAEITDKWLRLGNPWEVARPERAFDVMFGGRTEGWKDEKGRLRVRWIPDTVVKGTPYDTPIAGYGVGSCSTLRLWKAEAVESFDFNLFNHGDYYRAVEDKVSSENITKVLYPNDEPVQGKILRLQQQYFFTSCSLQNLLRIYLHFGGKPELFHEQFAIQLNDTHPSVAVAELMRLLVDELLLPWDVAWNAARRTFAYTNHTLLPEALEIWPLDIFGRLLPRHLEIIYEINRRFLDEVRERFPGDDARVGRMSLIDERGCRYVRMAHLAAVGSHRINGVARLHSELLKKLVMSDFAEMWPEKFCNVTNGVTPRRFVAVSNPGLAQLITRYAGDGWLKDLDQLRKLEAFADDPEFQKQWQGVKLGCKMRLAAVIEERTGVRLDTSAMFDVQCKRIHEYKRQHLNVLHILTLYLALKHDPNADIVPRAFVFGGKAAPGYFMAKRIIKLITSVAAVVNNDPVVKGRLAVAFFPDFNVQNAQQIYSAADLSEQISTAGKEASGTGNMKFSLNGALTIGTLDGANVEIREEVGEENFFLFGLTAAQVEEKKRAGYRPREICERDAELRAVIDFIGSGALAGGDRELFRPIVDNLLCDDPYMLLADYRPYIACQGRVSALWRDRRAWTRCSIVNTARMGKFSSDRSIRDYCRQIWDAKPLDA